MRKENYYLEKAKEFKRLAIEMRILQALCIVGLILYIAVALA